MKKLYSIEDLLKLDNNKNYELVKGELIEVAPVGFEHSKVTLNIGSILKKFVEKNNIGTVGVECGFVLSEEP